MQKRSRVTSLSEATLRDLPPVVSVYVSFTDSLTVACGYCKAEVGCICNSLDGERTTGRSHFARVRAFQVEKEKDDD